jgi:hypothetical protein
MISSISNALPSNAHQVSQPASQKALPQPEAAKGGALSQDQVTLKSTGNVDRTAAKNSRAF